MQTFDILVKTLLECLIFMIVSLFFYIRSSFRVKSYFKGFGINTRLIKLFFTKRVFKNKDFSKYGEIKKIIIILLILAKIQLKWSLDVYILQYCLLSVRTNSKKDSNAFELKHIWGLPWWHSGWESACQCRGHGFEPWSGRIPHATEQLGLWATATEPARLEPVLLNKRGRDGERPAHCDEEWPPARRN